VTALARALLGLRHAQGGSVRLFGQRLGALSERQQLQLRLPAAYVPQLEGEGLFPAWTGFDNLALSWIQHTPSQTISSQTIWEGMQAEAARYGIPLQWLTQPVAQRSRAERLALALWRHLRSRPELIVLEEWTVQTKMVSDLKTDVLLADALAVQPAMLLLTSETSGHLPHALAHWPASHGVLREGLLHWTAHTAQGQSHV
jgi:ABC-type branched-subunit amino acid transport system ATPase component